MKKLVALLVIVVVAMPAMAVTTVSCAQSGGAGSKVFTVSYTYSGADSMPRAFALDITTSTGTIAGVTAAKIGESTSAAKGFGIFPGTIVIDTAAGTVSNNGSPIAPDADLPAGTLDGIGFSGVTVELGSLYAAASGAPNVLGTANTQVLVTVAVSTVPATVTIVGNTARGSIVLENATSVAASTSCALAAITVCKGDVNASNTVTTADILPLINLLNTYGGKSKSIPSSNTNFNRAGDVNLDNANTTADILPLINMLNTYGGKSKSITCPHTY